MDLRSYVLDNSVPYLAAKLLKQDAPEKIRQVLHSSIILAFVSKIYFLIPQPQLLQRDFDINTGWQIKAHQRINCFVGWVNDVHQALMRTDFELITRCFVHVW